MKSDINSSCYKGDVASCYVQISVDCVFRILELSVGWFRRKEAGWLIHPSVEQKLATRINTGLLQDYIVIF